MRTPTIVRRRLARQHQPEGGGEHASTNQKVEANIPIPTIVSRRHIGVNEPSTIKAARKAIGPLNLQVTRGKGRTVLHSVPSLEQPLQSIFGTKISFDHQQHESYCLNSPPYLFKREQEDEEEEIRSHVTIDYFQAAREATGAPKSSR